MTPDFWRGKRVFVTGHTGFKGAWLSLWLQNLGANLTGYALDPPTVPSLFEVAAVGRGMTSIIDDVRDLAALQRAIQGASPEIVIHMAAQPLVRDSYKEPVETYSTNVMGTVHVLESVRRAPGVKAVVIVTTDKCYENHGSSSGYREDAPMGGADPYSSSKACAELVSAAYRSSYFAAGRGNSPAIATARAGNVIGGGDWARDRLVPDMVRAFEAGTPVRIRNPRAVRPWQLVLEPLRGYMDLAERLYRDGQQYAEAWNFGPRDEDARPVSWIVEKAAALWGKDARWEVDSSEHPPEAATLRLDTSKAQRRMGWRPLVGLDTALELTVQWARARMAGADMRSETVKQIASYQALATG